MAGRAELIRRRILKHLAEQPLFAGLSGAALSALADQMEWFALAGGNLLFDQGETSDGMFLLVHGRLLALRRGEHGQLREVGTIVPGETVGETGLLAEEPRNARVVALRDSELLFLPRVGFERLASLHAEAMLRMVQLALKRSYGGGAPKTHFNCIAILPATADTDPRDFASRFIAALGDPDGIELIDTHRGHDKEGGWFAEREAAMRHLIYLGNADPEWRERCLRQSDCVLLVADGSHPAQLQTRLSLPMRGPSIPVHVVLLQPGNPHPGSTRDWLELLPQCHAHHHVRGGADIDRLVRRLTGTANGIVLSGGGARGFAHLGVIRALRESGWVFDYVGGCSIGAIVGAGLASDWDDERMRRLFRAQFVESNPLSDWTLPLTSLRTGGSVSSRLRAGFGKRDIEDLPIPFFCVSSNLTDGALEVHERGPLWQALRASSAIPGILPPLFHGGRVLVDGGVIDNLPVGEMRKRLAGDIVAVDIGGHYRLRAEVEESESPPWWKLLPELFGRRRRPSIAQILLRAGMVNSLATTQKRRRQSRLLLTPALDGIDLLDWQAFDRAEAAGYDYTRQQLDELAAGGG